MKILHYSKEVIDNLETTYSVNGSGCEYTLNHPLSLIVDAEFIGKSSNYSNSQGWERDSNKYFKELYEMHPEYFSDSNRVRIMNNKAPIVNDKFLKYFPEYTDYKTQILVLHHIGGDGQMVAIPQDIHSKGFGEIHNVEKNLGIRDIAMTFSNQVEIKIDNMELEKGRRVTYYYDSLKERKGIDDDYKNDSKNESGNNNIIVNKTNNEVNDNYEITKKEKIGTIIKYTAGKIGVKVLSSAIEIGLPIAADLVTDLVFEGIKSKLNISMINKPSIDNEVPDNSNDIPVTILKNTIADSAKKKYTENDVPPGSQHYNTKNGRIYKEKPGYHRTGKKLR